MQLKMKKGTSDDFSGNKRSDALGAYANQKKLDNAIVSLLMRKENNHKHVKDHGYLKELDFSNGKGLYQELLLAIKRLYRALAFSIEDMKKYTTYDRKLI